MCYKSDTTIWHHKILIVLVIPNSIFSPTDTTISWWHERPGKHNNQQNSVVPTISKTYKELTNFCLFTDQIVCLMFETCFHVAWAGLALAEDDFEFWFSCLHLAFAEMTGMVCHHIWLLTDILKVLKATYWSLHKQTFYMNEVSIFEL